MSSTSFKLNKCGGVGGGDTRRWMGEGSGIKPKEEEIEGQEEWQRKRPTAVKLSRILFVVIVGAHLLVITPVRGAHTHTHCATTVRCLRIAVYRCVCVCTQFKSL